MMKDRLLLFLILLTLLSSATVVARDEAEAGAVAHTIDSRAKVAAEEASDWPMAGANPQRTSRNSVEVRGNLKPVWYKKFEPYISQKVQIVAALDTLYVSTAAGLYALDAETGAEKWVYATRMPLGHSPTIDTDAGIAYVGGFDHKLHAIDAHTGEPLWSFEASAGFHTNPLVVNGKVYAGNRDGNFYAIWTGGDLAGTLAWSYETGGPILFSAAYKDGVVYFASNDSHAYALNAETGGLVWKSAKLPGAGFHSWWPVVFEDRVIFAGSNNYRSLGNAPGAGSLFTGLELQEVYPNYKTDPRGTPVGMTGAEPGRWVNGTETIRANRILNYFALKPWRRTYFVLDRFTGEERESAPILWTGTHSGNRYPPLVGSDGVLYQQNNYFSDPWIAGGHVSGWKFGTEHISRITDVWNAVDEPVAYSAGGNFIYWSRCCDRMAGAIDISLPVSSSEPREWLYFVYNLDEVIPGYNDRYFNAHPDYTKPGAQFGGPNGLYSNHGDNNPPIPYQGKIYIHRSNALVAFDASGQEPVELPLAKQLAPTLSERITPLGRATLNKKLTTEVRKIIDAGHLRPAYITHGIFDGAAAHECGDRLGDYWHSSADTIYTLILAWPHLSSELQSEVQRYLENELVEYPPYEYGHVGWDGATRETFDVPPDANLEQYLDPVPRNYTFMNSGGWNQEGVWGRNPFVFYALWRYAATFGQANTILAESSGAFWEEFQSQPGDEALLHMPHVHNAYIAGYLGFLELQRIAGEPLNAEVKTELDRLFALRAQHFTPISPIDTSDKSNCRTLNASYNFIYMVPELAAYLRANAVTQVRETVRSYEYHAPYWFVSLAEEAYGENVLTTLYDTHALFMAKAWILAERQQTLERYLDVPAFPHGDLFFVQKLVVTIEAAATADFEVYMPLLLGK